MWVYLAELEQEKQKETTATTTKKRASSLSLSLSPRIPQRLVDPAYPLQQYINVLLMCDQINAAMEIVGRMELSTNVFCEMDKVAAWEKVWDYLRQKGWMFLDGNHNGRRKEYFEKRELFYRKVVPKMQSCGKSVLVDYFQDLIEKMQVSGNASEEERRYLVVASQHTVLRCLMCRKGAHDGLDEYLKIKWTAPAASAVAAAVTAAVGVAPLPMMLDNNNNSQDWAIRFLLLANPIPESLMDDNGELDLQRVLFGVKLQEEVEVVPLAETIADQDIHDEELADVEQPAETTALSASALGPTSKSEETESVDIDAGEENVQEAIPEKELEQQQQQLLPLVQGSADGAQADQEEEEEVEFLETDEEEEDDDDEEEDDDDDDEEEELSANYDELELAVPAGDEDQVLQDDVVDVDDTDDDDNDEVEQQQSDGEDSDDSADQEDDYDDEGEGDDEEVEPQRGYAESELEKFGDAEDEQPKLHRHGYPQPEGGEREYDEDDEVEPQRGYAEYEQEQSGSSDEEEEERDDQVVIIDADDDQESYDVGEETREEEEEEDSEEEVVGYGGTDNANYANAEAARAMAALTDMENSLERQKEDFEQEDDDDETRHELPEEDQVSSPRSSRREEDEHSADESPVKDSTGIDEAPAGLLDCSPEKAVGSDEAGQKELTYIEQEADFEQEEDSDDETRPELPEEDQISPPTSSRREEDEHSADESPVKDSTGTTEALVELLGSSPKKSVGLDEEGQQEPATGPRREGDETADERSVDKFFDSLGKENKPSVQETIEEEDRQSTDAEASIDDSNETDDEQERVQEVEKAETEVAAVAGEFGDTTEEDDGGGNKANLLAKADREADTHHVHNYGYASQLEEGYEPEDTHGYTEEEVSEAVYTEDEQEERRQAQQTTHIVDMTSTHENNIEPVQSVVPHSSDDMDAADEHTEQEEDLGAESSEREETADGPPVVQEYAHDPPLSPADERDPRTLEEYAQSAQRQHLRRHANPDEELSRAGDPTIEPPLTEATGSPEASLGTPQQETSVTVDKEKSTEAPEEESKQEEQETPPAVEKEKSTEAPEEESKQEEQEIPAVSSPGDTKSHAEVVGQDNQVDFLPRPGEEEQVAGVETVDPMDVDVKAEVAKDEVADDVATTLMELDAQNAEESQLDQEASNLTELQGSTSYMNLDREGETNEAAAKYSPENDVSPATDMPFKQEAVEESVDASSKAPESAGHTNNAPPSHNASGADAAQDQSPMSGVSSWMGESPHSMHGKSIIFEAIRSPATSSVTSFGISPDGGQKAITANVAIEGEPEQSEPVDASSMAANSTRRSTKTSTNDSDAGPSTVKDASSLAATRTRRSKKTSTTDSVGGLSTVKDASSMASTRTKRSTNTSTNDPDVGPGTVKDASSLAATRTRRSKKTSTVESVVGLSTVKEEAEDGDDRTVDEKKGPAKPKGRRGNGKPVQKFSLETGETIETYPTQVAAGAANFTSSSMIGSAIRSKKSAGGFGWRYIQIAEAAIDDTKPPTGAMRAAHNPLKEGEDGYDELNTADNALTNLRRGAKESTEGSTESPASRSSRKNDRSIASPAGRTRRSHIEPADADVLSASGGWIATLSTHPGNRAFREVCEEHSTEYFEGDNDDKERTTSRVVTYAKHEGRFLVQESSEKDWREMSPEEETSLVERTFKEFEGLSDDESDASPVAARKTKRSKKTSTTDSDGDLSTVKDASSMTATRPRRSKKTSTDDSVGGTSTVKDTSSLAATRTRRSKKTSTNDSVDGTSTVKDSSSLAATRTRRSKKTDTNDSVDGMSTVKEEAEDGDEKKGPAKPKGRGRRADVEKFSLKTGEAIDSYASQSKAAVANQTSQSAISMAIKTGKPVGGFGWRWKEETK
jgi:hypothetical protein